MDKEKIEKIKKELIELSETHSIRSEYDSFNGGVLFTVGFCMGLIAKYFDEE